MSRLTLFLLAFLATPAAAQNSPCYWSGNFVQCWPSTGILLDTQKAIRYGDATTNYVELKAPSSVTTYSMTWPTAQASGTKVLTNNGAGVLSWASGSGTVTNVTGTAPIQVATGTTTPVVSITQAGSGGDGYLSSTDWTTFNSKDQARTVGNLTEATSSVLTFTGGRGAVIGSGTTVQVTKADSTHNGYLGSGDWTTFNSVNVMTTLGDVIYENSTPAPARLAGSTSATKNFLTQTGNGSVSAVPAWGTIAAGDVPNLAASKITSGTLAVAQGGTNLASGTSGGVLAYTASGTLASSAALTGNAVVIGGGAGVVPTVVANNATGTNEFLTQSSSGTPAWGTIAAADIPNHSAAKITSGTLATAQGGTNLDTSASSGVAKVSSGTWSVATVVDADVSSSAAIAGSKLAAASASVAGAVTTGSQTLAGNKTFNGNVYGPATGSMMQQITASWINGVGASTGDIGNQAFLSAQASPGQGQNIDFTIGNQSGLLIVSNLSTPNTALALINGNSSVVIVSQDAGNVFSATATNSVIHVFRNGGIIRVTNCTGATKNLSFFFIGIIPSTNTGVANSNNTPC